MEQDTSEEKPSKPTTPRRATPKWEEETRDRIRQQIKHFSKPLGDLSQRQANEGDTRLLVTDFLCGALGYDKYSDLTTEYQVKGEFADYGIRLDNEIVAFLEVKRIGTKLGAKQLRQVEMYAVNEGVEWLLLTDAIDWQVFHLTGGLPVVIDHVFTVSLLDSEPIGHKVEKLFHLSRESFRRKQIDDLWRARKATAPKTLTPILLSDPVIQTLRRELKRITGHNVETADLVQLLRTSVIRPEALESSPGGAK